MEDGSSLAGWGALRDGGEADPVEVSTPVLT